VSVKADSPAIAVSGVRLVIEGITVKLTALDIKLDGAGVKTVMGKVPTVAISVACNEAANCEELRKVVERLTPLKRTTVPLTKPTPLTVNVNPIPPALTVDGERLVIDGLTARLTALELPPPGVGFKTVMGNVPANAISACRIVVVNFVALTKVVACATPSKRTDELLLKSEPLIVSVKLLPPAVTLAGERLLIAGTGLLTVKISAGVDVPPPGIGFVTVTEIVPAEVISGVDICAVNCVASTMVALWVVAPNLTVVPATKLLPLTIRVNPAARAVTLAGERPLVIGTGLLTVKVSGGVDGPPPGVGFVTVTELVPAEAISEADISAVNCVALTTVAL
jgi:hypothetical protein